jgi:hypothetical protein
VKRWLELSWEERRVLIAAAIGTTIARAMLVVVPWGRIVSARKRHPALPHSEGAIDLMSWAMDVCARRVPWATCLSNALAARWLLARRGVVVSIELGTYEADGAPHFHARVVCEGREIAGHRDMVVLASLDA